MRLRNTETAFDDFRKSESVPAAVRSLRWVAWPYRLPWGPLNRSALRAYPPTGHFRTVANKRASLVDALIDALTDPAGRCNGANRRFMQRFIWHTYHYRIQNRVRKAQGSEYAPC